MQQRDVQISISLHLGLKKGQFIRLQSTAHWLPSPRSLHPAVRLPVPTAERQGTRNRILHHQSFQITYQHSRLFRDPLEPQKELIARRTTGIPIHLLDPLIVHNIRSEIRVHSSHNKLKLCLSLAVIHSNCSLGEDLPYIAKLLPTHIRPPLLNAQKCRSLSRLCSSVYPFSLSSQRI